ncbi:MAG: SpoIIE family protein phosphatase [Deltaproteobacteria bacterium]|nr:SpoIIE family protein phosphatase [Deltaproteobacteria bacterium]
MAELVAVSGPSQGKRYPIGDECVLGRSFNSDVYIGDLNVSRRHARILIDQQKHVIEDLGSGNGTFVNDQQVTRCALASRDVIRIGGSSFRYEDESEEARWAPEVQTIIGQLMKPTGAGFPAITLPPSDDPKRATTPLIEEVTDEVPAATAERALTMLEAIYGVTDAIAAELDLESLLEKILDHLFQVFPQAERGFILLVNEATGQLVPQAVKQRGSHRGGLAFSQTMVDQLMAGGSGVIRGQTVPPPSTRPARTADLSRQRTQPSENVPKIGVPLTLRGASLGTLHLEGRAKAQPFSPDDLALLSAIARQAALAIENARTGQQVMAQQRLQADLELARKIQRSFLPHQLPDVPGVNFFTHYLPALHVGGDFFDIIQLADQRIGVLIGDISGKGVSAALLMAKVSTDLRLFSRQVTSPAEILTHANRTLMEANQDAMFATALYLMIDLKARTFAVANAGHQPPMVCSTRFEGISELDVASSVALGVVPDTVYPQETYELVPGDVIVLYTDGINEAMNRKGQEYGMRRLRSVLVTGPVAPQAVAERIIADIRRFVGNTPQSDDQTIVAFGLSAAF